MSGLNSNKQIVELQSIRGIAASIVMLGHSLDYFPVPGPVPSVIALFNGRAAVGMFFVLSGYVLTRMLDGRSPSLEGQLSFWIRRLFRIYPALLAATLFGLAIIVFKTKIGFPGAGEIVQQHFEPARLRPMYIALAFAGLGAHVIGPVWTIAVELVGSALIGSIAGLRSRCFFWLLVALLALAVTIGPATPYSVLMYLPFFMVGSSLWIFADRWQSALRRVTAQRLVIGAATIVLVGFRALFTLPYSDPKLAMLEMSLSALIVGTILHGNVVLPILRHPVVVWLGDISYSSYLLHVSVVLLAGSLVGRTAIGVRNPELGNLIVMVLTVAATLPLAALCYRYVELPGVRLGKRLSRYSWRERPAATADAPSNA